jgi:type III secretion protein L
MKFFSLLYGDGVHIAPGQQSIPSDEFSLLCTAAELLKKIESEAELFRRDQTAEAELIKEQAFQEGFQEGLLSLNSHIIALNAELEKIQKEVHQKILPLALKAARKIVGEELKLHPDRIIDIVMAALKPVVQHRHVTIYVNRADLEALETAKPKIRKLFDRLEHLSIQERSDVEPGGCMIETEAGIINAQLENQWRALEAAFESFMRKT